MPKQVVDRIPSRFLPLAALVAGRPDAAAVHLSAATDHGAVPEMVELRNEVDELRTEVAQLREELSFALAFVERLSPAPPTTR